MRTDTIPTSTTRQDHGQVLPLFALMLIVLLAFLALAIDVSNAYAARRAYRSAADAAALAGGLDLQQAGSRTVTNAERTSARGHALNVLASTFGATDPGATVPPTCVTSADFTDCSLPGTPYLVSVKTPSPSCVTCDPERSIQVTVRNPSFSLSFARVLGQDTWNVASTSVAGLTFSGQYALVTLRPPQPLPNGLDQNRQDVDVNGTNTVLNIIRGDVGTNTSAFTNSGGRIILASGYLIHHMDDITPDPWNKDLSGNPRGRLITNLIQDPAYPYASFASAPTYAQQINGIVSCTDPLYAASYPADYVSVLHNPALTVTCYKPGIYTRNFNVTSNTDVAYLMPGAYRFDGGLDVRGSLMGGLISGPSSGVVLVVPQTETLTANNAIRVWLNLGADTCALDGCRAAPAVDFGGSQVKTSDGYVISIEVARDNSCFSGNTPRLCTDNTNDALRLPGNGQLAVAGVVYAPSDNAQIAGDNSTQTGYVGQLITWSVVYSGGAHLNQDYPGGDALGVLRLDAACTAPSTVCNP